MQNHANSIRVEGGNTGNALRPEDTPQFAECLGGAFLAVERSRTSVLTRSTNTVLLASAGANAPSALGAR